MMRTDLSYRLEYSANLCSLPERRIWIVQSEYYSTCRVHWIVVSCRTTPDTYVSVGGKPRGYGPREEIPSIT